MTKDEHGVAIKVNGLVKKFGNFTAVNNISFDVKEGEIFGLLGPNGAGKTTTISILSTIISLTGGSASVYGNDVSTNKDAVRKQIGIVFQDPSLDDELTGLENLDLHARLYGVKNPQKTEAIKRVLKLVELEDVAKRQVRGYSGGMKRRLEIARGFIHNPKLLFLDEPTIGLDPQTRRRMWNYISDLNKKEKVTMILTTHYMEEADALCNRIAIIDHGKIIKLDTPERLKDSLGGDIIKVGTRKPKELAKELKKNKIAGKTKAFDEGLEITTKNGAVTLPKIIEVAASSGIDVEYATLKRPTLEDVFLHLTGKEIRAEAGDGINKAMKMMFTGRR
jgi:ABC-2 type transport system ATP-binding protein